MCLCARVCAFYSSQLCSLKEHYGAGGEVKGEKDCGSLATEVSSNWSRSFPISARKRENNEMCSAAADHLIVCHMMGKQSGIAGNQISVFIMKQKQLAACHSEGFHGNQKGAAVFFPVDVGFRCYMDAGMLCVMLSSTSYPLNTPKCTHLGFIMPSCPFQNTLIELHKSPPSPPLSSLHSGVLVSWPRDETKKKDFILYFDSQIHRNQKLDHIWVFNRSKSSIQVQHYQRLQIQLL